MLTPEFVACVSGLVGMMKMVLLFCLSVRAARFDRHPDPRSAGCSRAALTPSMVGRSRGFVCVHSTARRPPPWGTRSCTATRPVRGWAGVPNAVVARPAEARPRGCPSVLYYRPDRRRRGGPTGARRSAGAAVLATPPRTLSSMSAYKDGGEPGECGSLPPVGGILPVPHPPARRVLRRRRTPWSFPTVNVPPTPSPPDCCCPPCEPASSGLAWRRRW